MMSIIFDLAPQPSQPATPHTQGIMMEVVLRNLQELLYREVLVGSRVNPAWIVEGPPL